MMIVLFSQPGCFPPWQPVICRSQPQQDNACHRHTFPFLENGGGEASGSMMDHDKNINNFSAGIEKDYSVSQNTVVTSNVLRFMFSRKRHKSGLPSHYGNHVQLYFVKVINIPFQPVQSHVTPKDCRQTEATNRQTHNRHHFITRG